MLGWGDSSMKRAFLEVKRPWFHTQHCKRRNEREQTESPSSQKCMWGDAHENHQDSAKLHYAWTSKYHAIHINTYKFSHVICSCRCMFMIGVPLCGNQRQSQESFLKHCLYHIWGEGRDRATGCLKGSRDLPIPASRELEFIGLPATIDLHVFIQVPGTNLSSSHVYGKHFTKWGISLAHKHIQSYLSASLFGC